jgi:hypothetical protein
MWFDAQVKKLQDRMEKLRLENKRYRETNRTAEFEAAVAALQQQVRWCPDFFNMSGCHRAPHHGSVPAAWVWLTTVSSLHYLLQVQTANAAKVAAQQESHELRLKMRETDGEFTSDGKRCASCCSACSLMIVDLPALLSGFAWHPGRQGVWQ